MACITATNGRPHKHQTCRCTHAGHQCGVSTHHPRRFAQSTGRSAKLRHIQRDPIYATPASQSCPECLAVNRGAVLAKDAQKNRSHMRSCGRFLCASRRPTADGARGSRARPPRVRGTSVRPIGGARSAPSTYVIVSPRSNKSIGGTGDQALATALASVGAGPLRALSGGRASSSSSPRSAPTGH